jgi:hypothetical protein
MKRLVLIGALLAGACGAADDRPRTLEYITDTILAPTCANAECHSAFKQQVGDQFDTVDAARRSIVSNGLVHADDAADPSASLLIQSLTVGAPSILSPGSGNVRMPYDGPMPDADVELIKAWIGDGAPGAQCLATAQGNACILRHVAGMAAAVSQVVACGGDGNIGNVLDTCAQFCNIVSGNAQCGQ